MLPERVAKPDITAGGRGSIALGFALALIAAACSTQQPEAVPEWSVDPPARIAAGTGFSCALEAPMSEPSGQVVCWGDDRLGQAVAPDGQFVALAAAFGAYSMCGVRVDATLKCWGAVPFEPPAGRFQSVAVGYSGACALDLRGHVTCWGRALSGAPSEPLKALSARGLQACGLTHGGNAVCWGLAATEPPPGEFAAISVGDDHACGVRPAGSVECWASPGPLYGADEPPAGPFASVSAGTFFFTCGVRPAGSVECWGPDDHGRTPVPSGEFVAVATGADHACAQQTDGSVVCWGHNAAPLLDTPSGRFVDLHLTDHHGCALPIDSAEAVCWGDRDPGEEATTRGALSEGATTTGPYVESLEGYQYSCGIRHDSRGIDCWWKVAPYVWDMTDDGPVRREVDPNRVVVVAPGPFEDLGVSWFRLCGVHVGGSIECWESPRHDEPPLGLPWLDPPQGEFLRVSVGRSGACALDQDQAIVCWGPPAQRSPSQVTWVSRTNAAR